MNRGDKRRIQRVQQKIRKRGPQVRDFTVLFTALDNVPYITLRELKLLLPKEIYLTVIELTEKPKGLQIMKDGENEGIFAQNLHLVFERIKDIVRERKQELIH
ncbi:hypothetical protein LCGC14_0896950 [marine sediment metagenome]|uniref:Uncharacterized protein n=1 Tax=marine sediment metagenome TaxID=412755 RepID=A0A0F9NXP0_9ZZZZ